MGPEAQTETLEQGDIHFFYRPKVEEKDVADLSEVQGVYFVMRPHGKRRYRLAVMGAKGVPARDAGQDRRWGFIEMVRRGPEPVRDELRARMYRTKTRGRREVGAARPAGEGVYRLVRHGDHTHLAYALELPETPGPVQEHLGLQQEESLVMAVKNPEKRTPEGLPETEDAELPEHLQQVFEGRRWHRVEPPELLDRPDMEFLLVHAADNTRKELGVDLETSAEDETTAEIFRDLKVQGSRRPLEPLFEGSWA